MQVVTNKGRGVEAKSVTLEFNFGKDLQEAVKLYGESVVYEYYVGEAKIIFQNAVRQLIAAGKTQAEIAEKMKTWKPGVKAVRGKSPLEKVTGLLAKLTPEQKAAVKAALAKG